MTKRILHIIPTLDQAGAEKQLALLATGLDPREFEMHVIALTRGGPYEKTLREANVPLTIIGKRFKIDPLAWLKLRRRIKTLQPDLVQTWLFAANAYGRSAALSAGVRCVLGGERSVDPWKRRHELAIDRYLAKRSARIVVNSSGVRDFYESHGIPPHKFVVIPNAVAVPGPSRLSRAALLEELELPEDAKLIATVGRLWPQKRIEDAIWAADLLKVLRDDVHLLIIGDGPLLTRLFRFRSQVRIEDKVHFLGHRQDVQEILPLCDALWLASGYEGLPNSVMEAMAAGIPVVATDIPGTRDLVQHGETGYLFPVGDRAALARMTRELLDNPEKGRKMGEAGRARIGAEFSVEKMIARFSSLYHELLS